VIASVQTQACTPPPILHSAILSHTSLPYPSSTMFLPLNPAPPTTQLFVPSALLPLNYSPQRSSTVASTTLAPAHLSLHLFIPPLPPHQSSNPAINHLSRLSHQPSNPAINHLSQLFHQPSNPASNHLSQLFHQPSNPASNHLS
jgi:hypothetical protein